MTLVRDVMQPDPVVVSPDADVQTVIATLRESELQGVPVVDEDGRCVGIVTESDLVIADEEQELNLPHYFTLFGGVVFVEPLRRFEEKLRKAFASTAAEMMTADPDVISPDAKVEEAAHLIVESGHNRLPVIEDGRLVGVVTRVDVLAALAGRGG